MNDLVQPDSLQDILKVDFSPGLTPAEKKEVYLEQVGSSTAHMVDAVEVECVYGNMKLDKMLADLICK